MPERSWLLIRVALLPLAVGHEHSILHAYMPKHSTIADLADQLMHLYRVPCSHFRAGSAAAAPLHPSKRLCCIKAATAGAATAGAAALPSPSTSSALTLYATLPSWRVLTTAPGAISLTPDDVLLSGLQARAPLRSLLPQPAGAHPLTYFRHGVTDSDPTTGTSVDETRPISGFVNDHLSTFPVPAPTTLVPITVRCGDTLLREHAPLPDMWTLADLNAWMDASWGVLGATRLFVDSSPAPPGLCHASDYSALDAVVTTDTRPGNYAYPITLKVAGRQHLVSFVVQSRWSLWHLKWLIALTLGVSVGLQRLVFAGKVMVDNSQPLGAYEIFKGCAVHMVVRRLG